MMMKKIGKPLVCAALAAAILLLCSCGEKETKDISLYDLYCAMSAPADFADMKYVSSNDADAADIFKNISDMDYSAVEGFFINYAADGKGNADEIACIRVKDKADVKKALDSLKAHLKKRIGLYSTYDKSQLDKLNGAITASYGDVAVLIVCDNAKLSEKAFYDFLGE